MPSSSHTQSIAADQADSAGRGERVMRPLIAKEVAEALAAATPYGLVYYEGDLDDDDSMAVIDGDFDLKRVAKLLSARLGGSA